jgi:hypothetical protein
MVLRYFLALKMMLRAFSNGYDEKQGRKIFVAHFSHFSNQNKQQFLEVIRGSNVFHPDLSHGGYSAPTLLHEMMRSCPVAIIFGKIPHEMMRSCPAAIIFGKIAPLPSRHDAQLSRGNNFEEIEQYSIGIFVLMSVKVTGSIPVGCIFWTRQFLRVTSRCESTTTSLASRTHVTGPTACFGDVPLEY